MTVAQYMEKEGVDVTIRQEEGRGLACSLSSRIASFTRAALLATQGEVRRDQLLRSGKIASSWDPTIGSKNFWNSLAISSSCVRDVSIVERPVSTFEAAAGGLDSEIAHAGAHIQLFGTGRDGALTCCAQALKWVGWWYHWSFRRVDTGSLAPWAQ